MTRNHSNDGRSFEKSIEIICGQYEHQGRATISKVEPPCRVLGWGANRKVIFLENPFLDYCGVITEMGNRPAFFEAKSTSEPTLKAGGDGGLTASQIEAMARWRLAGAATWLLWEFDNAVSFWTYEMIIAGLTDRRSLIFSNGHLVESGKGFIFHDFIATAKRFEKYL